MPGHATLCYMVVGGNLNSPLNLFISFGKALMDQGFSSDPFLAKDGAEWNFLRTTVCPFRRIPTIGDFGIPNSLDSDGAPK